MHAISRMEFYRSLRRLDEGLMCKTGCLMTYAFGSVQKQMLSVSLVPNSLTCAGKVIFVK